MKSHPGEAQPAREFDRGSGKGGEEAGLQFLSEVDEGLPQSGELVSGSRPQVGRAMMVKGCCPWDPGDQKHRAGRPIRVTGWWSPQVHADASTRPGSCSRGCTPHSHPSHGCT